MNKKRGQAAMEFLMTYGWAILAAVVVIGVLAYFGVFSPSKLLPSSCTVSAPWGCDEFSIDTTGVNLVLRNGGGENLWLNDTAITDCTTKVTDSVVNDGTTQLVNVVCAGLTADDKFKGTLTVTYTKVGGLLAQTSTGTITGTVV